MVVALKRLATITLAAEATALSLVVSMIWWNSAGAGANGRTRGLLLLVERTGTGFWANVVAPSNVGIAVAVTAMAGIALAATLVYSNSGSLKSPWSRRRRKSPLSPQQWKSLFTPDGKFCDGGVRFLKKVRSGGVDPIIRAEVWPFLLGVYDLNSTQEQRNSIRNMKRKEYEHLRSLCGPQHKRNDEIIEVEKNSVSKGNEGSVNLGLHSPDSDVDGARESISIDRGTPEKILDHSTDDRAFHGFNSLVEGDDNDSGITNADTSPVSTESPDSDSIGESESMIISPFAENSSVSDPIESSKEDTSLSNEKCTSVRMSEEFASWQRIILLDAVRANSDWIVYSPAQAAIADNSARETAEAVGLKDFDHLEPCRILHAARLVAILEAYALYDPEIGYCQGMSDLLSPIIAFIEEDHLAFWCFVGFMKKARHNFRLDEVGISRQLNIVAKIIQSKDSYLYRHLQKLQAENCFFVYRMVVVLFRRELTFEQTVCMWEVMWADQAAIRAGISKSAWGRIRLRAPPTEDLLLFAIAACVLQRRKLIIEKYSSMEEIIKECNSMAGHLDVWKLLDDAHDLVVTLHNKI